LAFFSCKDDEKPRSPVKLKNGLQGRAWQLTRKKPELNVNNLVDNAKDNPQFAAELVTATVRSCCKKVAPLRKKEAFDLFFKRGGRKQHEAIQDYIGRRQNEYLDLTALSSATSLSEDLRAPGQTMQCANTHLDSAETNMIGEPSLQL